MGLAFLIKWVDCFAVSLCQKSLYYKLLCGSPTDKQQHLNLVQKLEAFSDFLQCPVIQNSKLIGIAQDVQCQHRMSTCCDGE